jgi:transposase
LILIVGGLLIMMGQHDRSEALFYYFRLEDQVPETHLLRLIEKHVSFAFVREKLKDSYSGTSRPSIDPELLLRILLIAIYTASPASASWWKSCACIWHGAGLPD